MLENDAKRYTCLAAQAHNLARLGPVASHRFFKEDVLACRGQRTDDRGPRIGGRKDDDEIHDRIGRNRIDAVVNLHALTDERLRPVGKISGPIRIARLNAMDDDLPCVGAGGHVGLRHHTRADQDGSLWQIIPHRTNLLQRSQRH